LTLTFKLFDVNLAQIRSAVPQIFHTQTKTQRLTAPKQNLPSSLRAVIIVFDHCFQQTRYHVSYTCHLATAVGSNSLSWRASYSTRTPPVEAHRPYFSNIVADRKFSTGCYLFTVSNSGRFSILSVFRPRPVSHAHFRHRHPSGLNSGIE